MTDEFRYTSYAQQIIFGAGALARLSQAVDTFHSLRSPRLMLCASGSARRNGTITRIESALGARLVAIYDCVQPHVQDFQVAEALALAAKNQIDAMIGLGGGSPIGMAKAVSCAFEESLDGAASSDVPKSTGRPARAAYPTDQPLIPVIAIPTTYAGSEMTPVYGITQHSSFDSAPSASLHGSATALRSGWDTTARKVTVSDPKIAPKLVIYDPLLTLDLPPELTASSGINALAHCVEAVYSITRHPLSTATALSGARYISRALPRCYAVGDDIEARAEMQIGSHLAGLALASVAMGLHHGLCHVLGGTAGVPHGIANAIILPHAMRFNADACAGELAQIAAAMVTRPDADMSHTRVGSRENIPRDGRDDETLAREAAQRVYNLVGQMNLPQQLRIVGVKENDLSRLAELAAQSRTVQNNPKPINAAQVEAILRDAW